MTKTKKRALELLHNGYYPHNSFRRVFPKWRQAYAIAKSEDNAFARIVAARLMGADPMPRVKNITTGLHPYCPCYVIPCEL